MAVRIGIPRSLAFYYLYPFMEGFLRELGAEVVLSSATDARILDSITCCPTDEPCVSTKLLYAHTKNLLDKQVDFILIPVLSSIRQDSYCCPKLIGAAYMVQHGLEIPPEKILAPEFNEKEKPGCWERDLYWIGEQLGKGKQAVRQAMRSGEARQKAFHQLTASGLTTPEAFSKLTGLPVKNRVFDPAAEFDPGQVIGAMGHSYILYDYVGHNIVPRLKEYGRVITPEMVSGKDALKEVETIYEGEKMWTYESLLLGSALHLLRRRLVSKMVFLEAFSCGPASIIESFIEEEAERQEIPFLLLTVDEHTGEAGLITRLEAFVDTARNKKEGRNTEVPPSFVPGERPCRARIGAPSVGWVDKALKTILQECSMEIVPTPLVTRRIVDLGKELAPEFICYPMIATLGQIRDLVEKGANEVVMVGGKGRCRLGWYAQLQELLLKRKKYDFQMTIIDSPLPFQKNWNRFRETVKKLTGNSSWVKIARAMNFGYHKILVLDEAENLVRRKQAYESSPGSALKAQKKLIGRVLAADSIKNVKKAEQDFFEEIISIPEEKVRALRVKIVGEFYTVIQNYVNQNVEDFLAARPGLRVYVDREMTASRWFDLHVLRKKKALLEHRKVMAAASPYLPVSVGGHGQESIGEVILAQEEGADGAIHLLPFTCMPEIVSQSILIPLCEKLDFPFLSLVVSEQTGTAGLETRLEAFLEVMLERSEKKPNGGGRVGLFPGN